MVIVLQSAFATVSSFFELMLLNNTNHEGYNIHFIEITYNFLKGFHGEKPGTIPEIA